MKNLVKEYKVTTMLSSLYPKEGTPIRDYILVSSEIQVKKFEVIQDVVSDHLPLYIDFN